MISVDIVVYNDINLLATDKASEKKKKSRVHVEEIIRFQNPICITIETIIHARVYAMYTHLHASASAVYCSSKAIFTRALLYENIKQQISLL